MTTQTIKQNVLTQDDKQLVEITFYNKLRETNIPLEKINGIVQYILKHYDYDRPYQELVSLAKFINVEGYGLYTKCENEFCDEWCDEDYLEESVYYNHNRVCPSCMESI